MSATIALAFGEYERRGIGNRSERRVLMNAQTYLCLHVHRRLGSRKELAVDSSQLVGIEKETASPFARLEEKFGADQQRIRRPQILVVAAPILLPVLGHEEVQMVQPGGEAHNGVVLELRSSVGICIAPTSDV